MVPTLRPACDPQILNCSNSLVMLSLSQQKQPHGDRFRHFYKIYAPMEWLTGILPKRTQARLCVHKIQLESRKVCLVGRTAPYGCVAYVTLTPTSTRHIFLSFFNLIIIISKNLKFKYSILKFIIITIIRKNYLFN